jgi:hypothetical protein
MARQTLTSATAALKRELAEENRHIDFAIRFEVYRKDDDGNAYATGEYSEVVGGKFDIWKRQYVADADHVETLGVSEEQFVCLNGTAREKLGKGGRGGGKSHLISRWTLKQVCRFPSGSVQLTSPTHKKALILWKKVLADTPKHWLLPGKRGVKLSARELCYANGCVVRFFSATIADGLRGEDNDAAAVDERQDVDQDAVDNIMLTLRRREDFEMLQVGTPKLGTDFHIEYVKFQDDDEAEVYSFPSFTNCFIPQGPRSVFAAAAKKMDRRRYQQEVLAEFVAMDGRVYSAFNRFRNVKAFKPMETTTWKVTNRMLRTGRDHIVGVDYRLDPMCAVVCRIGQNGVVWVVDEIVLRDDPSVPKMAKAIKAADYGDSWILDNSQLEKFGGKSSATAFKRAGFLVSHPNKAPHMMDPVNAVCAKFESFEGDVGMYIDPKCKVLIQALESRVLVDGRPDRSRGFECITDALNNVIYRLYPPKNLDGHGKVILNEERRMGH